MSRRCRRYCRTRRAGAASLAWELAVAKAAMNMARSRRLPTVRSDRSLALSASASAACACINASCAVVAAAAAYAAPRTASAAVAARSLRSPVPPQSRSLGGRWRYVAESESMAIHPKRSWHPVLALAVWPVASLSLPLRLVVCSSSSSYRLRWRSVHALHRMSLRAYSPTLPHSQGEIGV